MSDRFCSQNTKRQSELSPQGQLRQAQMLTELQSELVALHRRRRQFRRGVAIAGMFIVVGGAWLWSLQPWGRFAPQHIAQPTNELAPAEAGADRSSSPVVISSDGMSRSDVMSSSEGLNSPKGLSDRRVMEFSVATNRVGVELRYPVQRPVPRTDLGLESIGDDELASWLADAGTPQIVGRIDGDLRLFPLPKQ